MADDMTPEFMKGFEGNPVELSLSALLPSKNLDDLKLKDSKKFLKVVASVRAVGVIEPLIVFPTDDGKYVLLDGHVRVLAAQKLKLSSLPCLVAKDDESFTYNRRINRLATIQEHLMIKKALARGLSEEKLAEALDVEVRSIKRTVNLLDGICQEAIELLKDFEFSFRVTEFLRQMKPARQLEVVELMVAANQVTSSYCRAFLMTTPREQLVEKKKSTIKAALSVESIMRIERELNNVFSRYKMIEQTYGQDTLTLVLLRGYICKLLENETVVRYIYKQFAHLLPELHSVARVDSPNGPAESVINDL